MRTIKFLLWTACTIGFGIFLATGDLAGKTPLEQLRRGWKEIDGAQKVDGLKRRAADAFEDAKDALSSGNDIHERHSPEAREGINRLIAKRALRR
jgi:hypothetical protein